MTARKIPDRGDAIWLSFDPQAGRKQAGRRPAMVLRPASYNGKSGLVVVCPITSRAKGDPFESPLPDGLPLQGARRAEHICRLPEGLIDDVAAKVPALLG